MDRGEEYSYFSRQLRLPGFGEKELHTLQSSSVLVIGLGGIGCTLSDQLVGMGVGHLGLVDGDRVSKSNLSRQPLYNSKDEGQLKVEVASTKLENRSPRITLELFPEYLTPGLAKSIFPKFDLVVDCSDNFPTRYLVNDACVEFEKPFIFGGIDRDLIQWAVFNYKNGPTYRCIHPDEPLSSFIRSCDDRGVLSSVPAILGTIQARETIKAILHDPILKEFQFNILDTRTWTIDSLKAKKIPNSSNQKIKEVYGGWCNSLLVEEIDLASALDKKARLIDVREKHEYDAFHLDSAFHIPLGSLLERSSELNRQEFIVLYCKTGQRSLTGAEMLKKSGFENVLSLRSGIEEMVPDLG